jgi:hypothetical protein
MVNAGLPVTPTPSLSTRVPAPRQSQSRLQRAGLPGHIVANKLFLTEDNRTRVPARFSGDA